MASGGEAVARAEGKTVFVPYAAPDETARVRLVEERKTYARARLVAVETPSPERVEPPCPYFFRSGGGPWCGGCDWQHIRPASQSRIKKALLIEAFERIGKLQRPPVEETLALSQPWRYRHKVQVPFRVHDGRPAFGFYAPGTHDVVEFEDCLVQPESCTQVLKTLRALALERRWSAYDEDRGSGWLRHAALRVNGRSEVLVTLVTRTPDFHEPKEFCAQLTQAHPNVVGIHQNVNPEKTNRILGKNWRKLWGREALSYEVGPLRLKVSPASFFQVNEEAARLLCETAEKFLGNTDPDFLLDLYSGVGLFGLYLSGKAHKVVGLEENPHAVRDARENQKLNRAPNARFEAMSLERGLPGWFKEALRGRRAAALVDPPRTGLSARLVQDLKTLKADPLIYVSCDAATLSRDVALLCAGPYALKASRPLDLFPQTPHIESVSLLRLKNHA